VDFPTLRSVAILLRLEESMCMAIAVSLVSSGILFLSKRLNCFSSSIRLLSTMLAIVMREGMCLFNLFVLFCVEHPHMILIRIRLAFSQNSIIKFIIFIIDLSKEAIPH